MNPRTLARFLYPLSVTLLIAFIGVLAGMLLIAVLPELAGMAEESRATASPSISPAPTSPMAGGPIQIEMSPDADCGACHVDVGGIVGTNPIPVMAHPLEGWRECTACHADDRLVKSAPGHSGLHKSECLTCHQEPGAVTAAPPRPHHLVTGQACVACHGSRAPLPTDMQGRTNCWLCHPGAEFDDLFGSSDQALPRSSPVAPNGKPRARIRRRRARFRRAGGQLGFPRRPDGLDRGWLRVGPMDPYRACPGHRRRGPDGTSSVRPWRSILGCIPTPGRSAACPQP